MGAQNREDVVSRREAQYMLNYYDVPDIVLGIFDKLSPNLETVKVLFAQSCLTLWDPWTVVHQAPLSM